jgi:cytochrome d ubiquinol oxidase subunit II
VLPGGEWAWLGLFPLAIGALAVALCAYLAAVYLTWETNGEVQEDFRLRALVAWFVAGVLSVAVLLLAAVDAPRLWQQLLGGVGTPVLVGGILMAPAAAWALWRRRYSLARVLAAGQVVALLTGWALAQLPYVVYPDITLAGSAAPAATLSFVLWTLPFGLATLLPSLWFLFSVFKGRNPAVERTRQEENHG